MPKKGRRSFFEELALDMAEAIAEAVNEIGRRRAKAETPDDAPDVAVIKYPIDELRARRALNRRRKK